VLKFSAKICPDTSQRKPGLLAPQDPKKSKIYPDWEGLSRVLL
jgi:hypothetical protein